MEVRLLFFEWTITAADGVSSPLLNKACSRSRLHTPNQVQSLGHTEWVRIFNRAVDRFKNSLPRDQRESFRGAKIIYSTLRFMSAGDGTDDEPGMRRWLRDCLALKEQFPAQICGTPTSLDVREAFRGTQSFLQASTL